MTTTMVNVEGMTCEHCVRAVTDELRALPGVSDVRVELEPGTAEITSDAELDPEAVRGAVEEAGYQLAPT